MESVLGGSNKEFPAKPLWKGWWLYDANEDVPVGKHAKMYIVNDYKYECNIYIYLKNDPDKFERFKNFYVLNYKKYYNIDQILTKC